MPELEYRSNLYQGTAHFYDRFRPPYPQELLSHLCERVPVTGRGNLLDLACGTGQITFALAEHFGQVWAVDQEEELIAIGRNKATSVEAKNTKWLTGSAETVALDVQFELIAVGNAFHRLQRPVVAKRMLAWLEPGGAVALVWSAVPWRGDRPWQRAMTRLLTKWVRETDAAQRVPAGWEEMMAQDSHEEVLRQVGFDYEGRFEFSDVRSWSLEALAGYVFSTSFLNQKVLGPKVAEFERELADCLLPIAPEGTFEDSTSAAYDLARKPQRFR